MSESAHPPGAEPNAVCAGCGRESFDPDKRRLIMEPSMSRRKEIFQLATTLYILVTDN